MRRSERAILVGGIAVACLPLIAVAAVVSGSTSNAFPGVLGLVVTIALAVAVAKRRRKWAVALSVAAVALLLTLGSTALSRRVDHERELTAAPYGRPISFVVAELGFSPETLPQTFAWNPWEHPATLDSGRFVASYASVLALGSALLLAVRLCRRFVSRLTQLDKSGAI